MQIQTKLLIVFALSTFLISNIYAENKSNHNIEAITNHGTFLYQVDNTGESDVSNELQEIFNKLSSLEDVSASIIFSPGVYYLNSPVSIEMAGVKLIGHGHGGIDVHGANIKNGTIFHLGKGCTPYAITFNYAGRTKSFPAGESPWPNKNSKVEIENISFVGYNNTGVNTAEGYSRFRKDVPNFRELNWYPAKGRYDNVEKEGQRAIYLPPAPKGESWGWNKCELLRITGCYFTELYVAVEAAYTDVSYIDKNWFGQCTYALRLNGPGMMINNNLFADLETALTIEKTRFSTYSNNTFAYVGKCFEIKNISASSISGNVLENMKKNTGAAASGAFIFVEKSNGLNVIGNSVIHPHDSRKKTISIDAEPNGQSYIQFENSEHLIFSNNIINTPITQTVVRLHNCSQCVVIDNIINFGKGGNAVAETGECKGNFYRKLDLNDSDTFDIYKN
ncbi:hypothetical protein [Seonamhaeicola marinus]|uniref:Right-handed parallel beta-helix repeat-containing protein n=1 Tax=Seonamhaeicola marinus TaxID=1912246 RepID=A0A5D0J1A1_9FLAO|nr:hypothetical protein [Seonamhaeicola marinus]TYA89251.1 hypothetical protein FUA24_03720 [Seonamhaeicola marinus]